MNVFLLFWVLPSLITGLLILRNAGDVMLDELTNWNFGDYFMWFLISFIYPTGLIILLIEKTGRITCKPCEWLFSLLSYKLW